MLVAAVSSLGRWIAMSGRELKPLDNLNVNAQLNSYSIRCSAAKADLLREATSHELLLQNTAPRAHVEPTSLRVFVCIRKCLVDTTTFMCECEARVHAYVRTNANAWGWVCMRVRYFCYSL